LRACPCFVSPSARHGVFTVRHCDARKFVEKTQEDYIHHVKGLTIFFSRSPDTAAAEDLRRYQPHLTENGIGAPSVNSAVSALRFFFSITLDRPEVTKLLTFVAELQKTPVVLSPEEVRRFLDATPGPNYKAAFSACSCSKMYLALELGDG
jgi:integrase/recombinase XerD